jgi:hypothetical protein
MRSWFAGLANPNNCEDLVLGRLTVISRRGIPFELTDDGGDLRDGISDASPTVILQ